LQHPRSRPSHQLSIDPECLVPARQPDSPLRLLASDSLSNGVCVTFASPPLPFHYFPQLVGLLPSARCFEFVQTISNLFSPPCIYPRRTSPSHSFTHTQPQPSSFPLCRSLSWCRTLSFFHLRPLPELCSLTPPPPPRSVHFRWLDLPTFNPFAHHEVLLPYPLPSVHFAGRCRPCSLRRHWSCCGCQDRQCRSPAFPVPCCKAISRRYKCRQRRSSFCSSSCS
jgi:hypothetical protein